jgi:serine/threonine-protein kinase
MQLFEGTTLEDRLRHGPLPAGEATRLAADVAGALEHAHRRGVVHRDLKAAHVLITPPGARVLGFGFTPPGPRRAAGSAEVWQSSISPEELAGGEADARSDVFRLGALLYEMVTGRRPFAGEGAAEIRRAIQEEAPAPPSSLRAGIPRSLDEVVLRALARNPADRPPDGGAMLAELARAGEDLNALLLAHQPLPRRRRRHFGTLLPTLAAIAMLVIIWLLWRALKLNLP